MISIHTWNNQAYQNLALYQFSSYHWSVPLINFIVKSINSQDVKTFCVEHKSLVQRLICLRLIDLTRLMAISKQRSRLIVLILNKIESHSFSTKMLKLFVLNRLGFMIHTLRTALGEQI